jgi:hypothetical protein
MAVMNTGVSRVMGGKIEGWSLEGQSHLSCLFRRVAVEEVMTFAGKIHPGVFMAGRRSSPTAAITRSVLCSE